MEIGKDDLSILDEPVFLFDRFLDLHDHFGSGIDLFDGWKYPGSDSLIGAIGKTTVLTCRVLDVNGMTVFSNSFAPDGVNAIRLSLFLISFGTPIIIMKVFRGLTSAIKVIKSIK